MVVCSSVRGCVRGCDPARTVRSYLAHEPWQLGDQARGRVVGVEEGLPTGHHHLRTGPEGRKRRGMGGGRKEG